MLRAVCRRRREFGAAGIASRRDEAFVLLSLVPVQQHERQGLIEVGAQRIEQLLPSFETIRQRLARASLATICAIVAARPAYHYVADETGDKDGNSERTGGNDDPLLTPLGLHAVAVETDSEDDPFTTLLDRFQPMESLFLEYCLGDNDGDLSPQCEALTCEAPPLPATLSRLPRRARTAN